MREDDEAPGPATPAAGLTALIAGNRRFAAGEARHPDASPRWRRGLVDRQAPFAVVVGCVDSRVPPEIVLDRGLGDLLTVRTAGHALEGAARGSIEFGVTELGIGLVVVMGHTGCGAIAAAIARGSAAPATADDLDQLVGEIASRVGPAGAPGRRSDPATAWVANVGAAVAELRALPWMAQVAVVGLLYDLESGLVTVLDDAGLAAPR